MAKRSNKRTSGKRRHRGGQGTHVNSPILVKPIQYEQKPKSNTTITNSVKNNSAVKKKKTWRGIREEKRTLEVSRGYIAWYDGDKLKGKLHISCIKNMYLGKQDAKTIVAFEVDKDSQFCSSPNETHRNIANYDDKYVFVLNGKDNPVIAKLEQLFGKNKIHSPLGNINILVKHIFNKTKTPTNNRGNYFSEKPHSVNVGEMKRENIMGLNVAKLQNTLYKLTTGINDATFHRRSINTLESVKERND